MKRAIEKILLGLLLVPLTAFITIADHLNTVDNTVDPKEIKIEGAENCTRCSDI